MLNLAYIRVFISSFYILCLSLVSGLKSRGETDTSTDPFPFHHKDALSLVSLVRAKADEERNAVLIIN